MKRSRMEKIKGILTVLMLNIFAFTNAQYNGYFWGRQGDEEGRLEYTNCSLSSVCDDNNVNTTDICSNGYCINSAPSSFTNNHRHSITGFISDNNDIWVATHRDVNNGNTGYISQYTQNNWVIHSVPTNHYSTWNFIDPKFCEDNNGNIYYFHRSSTSVLYQFDGTAWNQFDMNNSGLNASTINYIEFNDQELIIGTNNGVFFYTPSTGAWTTFNTNNSGLLSDYVNILTIDHLGRYWFSHNNGLSYFDGNTWQTFSNSTIGIPINENIYKILVQHNNEIGVSSTDFKLHTYDFTNWTSHPQQIDNAILDSQEKIAGFNYLGDAYLYDNGQMNTLPSLNVNGAYVKFIDSKNHLFDFGYAIDIYDYPNNTIYQNLPLGYDSIGSFFEKDNQILVVGGENIYLLNSADTNITAINDTVEILANSTSQIYPIINDIYDNQSLELSVLSPPSNASIVLNGLSNDTIIFTPNLNYLGIDSFQYLLCSNTVFPECDSAWVFINQVLPTDSVWPGDTNSDGVVNVWDVLSIGIGYNNTGPSRPFASNNWVAQACANWQNNFGNLVNYKHADCDGNATIDSFDVDIVDLNYGLTHSKGPGPKSINGIPLFLDINPQTYIAGSTVTGTINLGTIGTPAVDLYGIAFSLNYDNTIIEENTVSIDFSNSWLAPSTNLINLDKDFWALNKVDIGTSKTDQVNGNGFGPIATIEFNIQENLAGKTDEEIVKLLELSFTDILAVDFDYTEIDINGKIDTLYATQVVGIKNIPELEFKVYPNPVENELNIQAANKIASIQIINVLGQVLASYSDIESTNTAIPFEDFDKGVYFIQIVGENQSKANLRVIKK